MVVAVLKESCVERCMRVAEELLLVWSRFESTKQGELQLSCTLVVVIKLMSYNQVAEPSYVEFVRHDLLSSTSIFFAV